MINQHRLEEHIHSHTHTHTHTTLSSSQLPINSLTPLLDLTQPCQGSNVLTSCPAFSIHHVCVCLSIWHQPTNPLSCFFFPFFTLHASSTSQLPTDYPKTNVSLLPFEPVMLLFQPTANWAWNNFCSGVTAAHLHHVVICWQKRADWDEGSAFCGCSLTLSILVWSNKGHGLSACPAGPTRTQGCCVT